MLAAGVVGVAFNAHFPVGLLPKDVCDFRQYRLRLQTELVTIEIEIDSITFGTKERPREAYARRVPREALRFRLRLKANGNSGV